MAEIIIKVIIFSFCSLRLQIFSPQIILWIERVLVLHKLINIALGHWLPTSHHVRKFTCSLSFILIEYAIYCPDFTDKETGKERLSNLCYLLQVRNAKLRDKLMQNGSNKLSWQLLYADSSHINIQLETSEKCSWKTLVWIISKDE